MRPSFRLCRRSLAFRSNPASLDHNLLRLLEDFSEVAFDRFDFNSSPAAAGGGWGFGFLLGRSGLWRGCQRGQIRSGGNIIRFTVRRLGILLRNIPIRPFLEPGTITLKRPHAVLGADLQRGNDLEKVPVADVRLDRSGRYQNLALGHADVQVRTKAKSLRDDRHEAIGELRRDAVLDLRGKGRDDPLQG